MRVFLSFLVLGAALRVNEGESINPIRRVVNILQATQKKIEEEGRKEADLFERFQCFCKNGAGKLAAEIAESEKTMAGADSLSKQKASEAERLDQEIKQHKQDRQDSKDKIQEAKALRAREEAEYQKLKATLEGQNGQLGDAIDALEKGMGKGKSFLQSTSKLANLQKLAISFKLSDDDRDTLVNFLQNPFGDYASQSGEIVGILKAMLDQQTKDAMDAKEANEKAIADTNALIKEQVAIIAAATKAIEEKSVRKGEAAVAAVEAKNAGAAATAQLQADKEFLANLDQNCKDKQTEFDERNAERAVELKGVMEAIGILNNDEALDVFKKTLKTPELAEAGASLLQTGERSDVRARALRIMDGVSKVSSNPSRLNLISYSLRSGKVSFEKVLGMIDEMIKTLADEQKDDDDMLKYCNSELESASDTLKELNRNHKKEAASIAALEENVATLTEDMSNLKKEMEADAKAVAEATKLRKEENADFQESQAQLEAAMQLIKKATNVIACTMGAPTCTTTAGPQLSADERIAQNLGETIATKAPTMIAGTNVVAIQEKPAPAPETWGGPREGNTNTFTGVSTLMENLVNELKKEFETAEFDEKKAQEDYENLLAESKKKAKADAESMTQMNNDKAQAESDLADTNSQHESTENAIEAEEARQAALHGECDFLIANFDFRKEARGKEAEGMKQAKAVLAGAGFA